MLPIALRNRIEIVGNVSSIVRNESKTNETGRKYYVRIPENQECAKKRVL